MSPADLPTKKALNIISQIADFGSPILVLSGGEPLYRHDIFELAEYATSRGLRTALATNGTLVTKDIAEKIKKAGIKRVSISASTDPTRSPTIPSAVFRARLKQPFTACAI
jgi:AdoMet-dependent heme synthase